MTIFEDRERAFEAEWVRQAEFGTRLRARRNRLFAEWAVAEAGLEGASAAERVREYVKLDFATEGEAALLDRVAADLGRTPDMLRSDLARFGRQAEEELQA